MGSLSRPTPGTITMISKFNPLFIPGSSSILEILPHSLKGQTQGFPDGGIVTPIVTPCLKSTKNICFLLKNNKRHAEPETD